MKTKQFLKPFETIFFLLLFTTIIFVGCNKDDDPEDQEPTTVLDKDYTGELSVSYINTMPPWSSSTTMNVQIEKTQGNITITAGTLTYAGDSIDVSTKIERSGQWNLTPLGELKANGNTFDVEVNAQAIVQNDVQKTYTKDFDGNWVLEAEDSFDNPPNSNLVFIFNDATSVGSVVTETTDSTSVTWTLTLTPQALLN
ncbi:MAG: hypothetical protein KQH67_01025 [Bacteroidetes bacterium]|nr:hypothetical protein [Bacteroidota bacterium]